jgi:hypothetical protein
MPDQGKGSARRQLCTAAEMAPKWDTMIANTRAKRFRRRAWEWMTKDGGK